jgi:hypothetical protein
VVENSLMMMMPFVFVSVRTNKRHHHHQGVFSHKLDNHFAALVVLASTKNPKGLNKWCYACLPGKYTPAPGYTGCLPCDAGKISPAEASTCTTAMRGNIHVTPRSLGRCNYCQ